jgi:hypothetical protein
MKTLWEAIKADPTMSSQLIDSRLVGQFQFREPDGIITIDCSDGQNFKIIVGPTDIKPVIEMSMKSDIAHEFWLGRISIPVALLTGKIVSKGPTPKALALLPIIRPAYSMYPKILEAARKNVLVNS